MIISTMELGDNKYDGKELPDNKYDLESRGYARFFYTTSHEQETI